MLGEVTPLKDCVLEFSQDIQFTKFINQGELEDEDGKIYSIRQDWNGNFNFKLIE